MNTKQQFNNADIIKQAAAWLIKLHEAPLSATEFDALDDWRKQSIEHELAWQKAAQLQSKLKAIPREFGMSILDRTVSADRRAFMKSIAVIAIVTPTGLLAYRYTPWQNLTADYATAVGEIKSIQLADGSALTLNTNTAVDIHYDDKQRVIKLFSGELYIETAHDAQNRPLSVVTKHGRLTALGTKFVVRTEADFSYIGLIEGAVKIETDGDVKPSVIYAGSQSTFSASAISPLTQIDANAKSWVDGIIYADGMPLQTFVELLNRYRKGILMCDDAAKDILISGAFQLKDTDKILETIQNTRPIKITWRTRYWGTLHKV